MQFCNRRVWVGLVFSVPLAAGAAGCESKAGSGAVIGTLIGAGAGAAIGSASHARAGEGAAIGAGVGLLTGALIGAAADSADDDRRRRQSYDRVYAETSAPAGAVVYQAPAYQQAQPLYQTPAYQVDARNLNVQQPVAVDQRPAGSYGYQLTDKDVIRWTMQGVREDIIIDRIQRSGSTFRLTAADENRLRDEGVSEAVLAAMRPKGAGGGAVGGNGSVAPASRK